MNAPLQICLDANVFIAACSPEPAQEACCTLIEQCEQRGIIFVEPAVVVFEVTSAWRKQCFLKHRSRHSTVEAESLFFELPIVLEWKHELLADARLVAESLHWKNLYDPAYLAVAKRHRIPLITLDHDLQRKGQRLHRDIWSVDEYLQM